MLEGECILVVEGEERRLRQWDYFHCPPGTEHITVGAGDGPCAILMLGTRIPGQADPVSRGRGRGEVRRLGRAETDSPREAYAGSAARRAGAVAVAELRSCAVELAALRAEPDDGAEQVTQAVLGEPLWVEEERDGWARVRTVYDYPGWIRLAELRGDPVAEARRFLGVPYEWGGLTERGIDCSGLVHVAYRRAGRVVPRDADEQEDAGEEVAEAELRPGDLVSYGPRTGRPTTSRSGSATAGSCTRRAATGWARWSRSPSRRACRRGAGSCFGL